MEEDIAISGIVTRAPGCTRRRMKRLCSLWEAIIDIGIGIAIAIGFRRPIPPIAIAIPIPIPTLLAFRFYFGDSHQNPRTPRANIAVEH